MNCTHEIRAEDLNWAELNFESPEKAFKFADKLERMAADPNISEATKQQIDECLDDLFATLFDLG
jgi:hypothetical protein